MGLTRDDCDRGRATFTCPAARAELDGLPDRHGRNIPHEGVDRHAAGLRGSQLGRSGVSGVARPRLDGHADFVVALHGAPGVEILETDYPKLATLDACVEYLGARR